MHTACVWSEKTTVCRIFSCQRVRVALGLALPFAFRRPAVFLRVLSAYHPQSVVQARAFLGELAKSGGEYRARTGDLLVANQALSQLS